MRPIKVSDVQVKMPDLRTFRGWFFLGALFVSLKDLFEIQGVATGTLNAIRTNERDSISEYPDAFEPFRCLQSELDVDAVRVIEVDGLGKGVVGGSDRISQIEKPLQQACKIACVRRMDGDMVKTTVALLVRRLCATVKHEQGLVCRADLDAVTITRASLKAGKLLPKPRSPLRISHLKMNRPEGDEVLTFHVSPDDAELCRIAAILDCAYRLRPTISRSQ